jgi:hypothetical protein
MDVVLIKQQNLAFKKQLVLLRRSFLSANMTGIISADTNYFHFFTLELFPLSVLSFYFLCCANVN